MDEHTVHCVEDEPNIALLIERTLKVLPVKIISSGNGVDALEKMSQHPPDLVILDLMLPRMSGWEMLQKLRNSNTLSDVAVIILTVRDTSKDRERGEQLGVSHYMTKPFGPKELQHVVSDILGIQQ